MFARDRDQQIGQGGEGKANLRLGGSAREHEMARRLRPSYALRPERRLADARHPLEDHRELRSAPDGSALPKAVVAALGDASAGSATTVTAVTTALLELLSTSGEQQPILVLVDDGHWLDPSTASVVGLLSRQLFADRVAILVAFRPVDEPVSNERRAAIGLVDQRGSVAAFRDLDTVELMVLSPTDSEAALRTAGCPEALVAELAARCGGLPLAIREVQRQLEGGVTDLRRLSVSVPEAYRARVAQLDGRSRLAVLAAAMTDDLRVLRKLGSEIVEDLQVAEQQEIVTLSGGFGTRCFERPRSATRPPLKIDACADGWPRPTLP